jgi:hypothetical protein
VNYVLADPKRRPTEGGRKSILAASTTARATTGYLRTSSQSAETWPVQFGRQRARGTGGRLLFGRDELS